jgi:DNA-binding NarL/FixJ family response regulator
MSRPIRVVLADDHPVVRAGLRLTLTAEPDIVLAGEATSGDEARRLVRELQPDVLLLDLSMPGPPAAETVAYLRERWPALRVLVLTAYDDDIYVRGLVAAGVAGYVLKDELAETLIQAIRSIVRGGAWFSQRVIDKFMHPGQPLPLVAPELTDRERQLLGLLTEGRDNARIAEALYLSEQTVRNYLSRLYAKLGVHTRTEAVVWARDHGLA